MADFGVFPWVWERILEESSNLSGLSRHDERVLCLDLRRQAREQVAFSDASLAEADLFDLRECLRQSVDEECHGGDLSGPSC